jgi:hypothetical protein
MIATVLPLFLSQEHCEGFISKRLSGNSEKVGGNSKALHNSNDARHNRDDVNLD